MRQVLTIGNTRYALQEEGGRLHLTRIAPYDETEYHWAVSNQERNRWTLYRHSPGRAVCTIGTDSAEEVAALCKANDEDRGLTRTGGIWQDPFGKALKSSEGGTPMINIVIKVWRGIVSDVYTDDPNVKITIIDEDELDDDDDDGDDTDDTPLPEHRVYG